MRKITPIQILAFLVLLAPGSALAVLSTRWLLSRLPPGEFRPIAAIVTLLLVFFVLTVATHRLFLRLAPLRAGEIPVGSRQEFVYHVYLLFYLLVFHPVIRSSFLPVPVLRLVYLMLGATLGTNTYSSGIIYDPLFVRVGSNTILGQTSLLVPHVIEGVRLAHYPITIGNDVTIGAHAVILSGVEIGNDAVVASGAVVSKDTRIGDGEIWGGVPARRLREGARK